MKSKKTLKAILEIFSIFFYTAIFTFGGGVAMLPVLEKIMVEKKKYLEEKEFLEFFSLTQILPGSIMCNMAVFVGYRIAKFLGALVCVIAITIPPLTIITLIAIFYGRLIEYPIVKKIMLGILAGVVGEVSGIILNMFKRTKFNNFKIFLLLFSFFLMFVFRLNPIYVVIIGALSGILLGKED
uniref:Chromate transporter n=1 Tax=candidate division WOR-3 bacterium TaxID=2052148 RepID=A0A7C4U9T0_UNCW3